MPVCYCTSLRRVVKVLIWFLYSSSRWLAYEFHWNMGFDFEFFSYWISFINHDFFPHRKYINYYDGKKQILNWIINQPFHWQTKKPYLLFGDFKGFQVVAHDTEFLFKFNDFAVMNKANKHEIIKIFASNFFFSLVNWLAISYQCGNKNDRCY